MIGEKLSSLQVAKMKLIYRPVRSSSRRKGDGLKGTGVGYHYFKTIRVLKSFFQRRVILKKIDLITHSCSQRALSDQTDRQADGQNYYAYFYLILYECIVLSIREILRKEHKLGNFVQQGRFIIPTKKWGYLINLYVSRIVVNVDRVIKHGSYNPNTFENDIALLRLATAVS